jgi:hypothetical protein
MGMARQAPTTAVTGCLVCELEAESEEKGEDDLAERLGVAQERSVGRFIVEIDGDGTVLACRFDGLSHGSPSVQMAIVRMRHGEGNVLKDQAYGKRLRVSPRNSVECALRLVLS